MIKGDVEMAKCFSKKYGNKGWAFNYLVPAIQIKVMSRCLSAPDATSSKTIVNILLSWIQALDTMRPVASLAEACSWGRDVGMQYQALTGILNNFYLDWRYRVVESSSLVSILFRKAFSHPNLSFFHLLVNCHTVQLKPMIKAHISGRMVSSGISDVMITSVYSEKTRPKKLMRIMIITRKWFPLQGERAHSLNFVCLYIL